MSVCTFLAANLPLPRIERHEAETVGLFPSCAHIETVVLLRREN